MMGHTMSEERFKWQERASLAEEDSPSAAEAPSTLKYPYECRFLIALPAPKRRSWSLKAVSVMRFIHGRARTNGAAPRRE